MKRAFAGIGFVMVLCANLFGQAQQSVATNSSTIVPTLVKYSGTVTDVNGKPLSGTVGVTFLLYQGEQGGAPLWMETQNVQPDRTGHYTVVLGSTTSQGLPTDLFASGEARWLGVQAQAQAEQPRVLLLSVPYALKAGDAQTVGGLPASAFVLAKGVKENVAGRSAAAAAAVPSGSSKTPPPANPNVTGKGTVDFIPMWDSASDVQNSVIFQKTSNVGIGTTAPAATLDVNGKGDVRDTLTLFPKATDSTLAINGTAFKIDQTGKVTFITGQTFPGAGTITGITTAAGSGLSGGGTAGTLSLKVPAGGITNAMLQKSTITLNANTAGGLTTPGSMTLGSTYTIGLKPCAANQVLQYSGTAWNCAATGAGTITGVTAGTDLTGGGTSGKVTLNLDTTKVPLLKAANSFAGNQTIAGNLGATGSITGATGTYTSNSASPVLNVTQNGSGIGIISNSTSSAALYGAGPVGVSGVGGSGASVGVQGVSSTGWAVYAATTSGLGVFSSSNAPNAVGSIEGFAGSNASGANTPGVTGYSTTQLGVGTRGLWSKASTIGATVVQAGVWGDSTAGDGVIGSSDSSVGVYGESASFHGVAGFSKGAGAAGVNGSTSSTGYGVLGQANGSAGQGVWGESFGAAIANGAGSDGVHGVTHSIAGSGVTGVNTATDGTGVYGSDPSGWGFFSDSHAGQARGAGGWVKAMAYVQPASSVIVRCFNSQLTGSTAGTVPCGMTFTYLGVGNYLIDFGFRVDDRFFLVTPTQSIYQYQLAACLDDACGITSNQAEIFTNTGADVPFFVIVF